MTILRLRYVLEQRLIRLRSSHRLGQCSSKIYAEPGRRCGCTLVDPEQQITRRLPTVLDSIAPSHPLRCPQVRPARFGTPSASRASSIGRRYAGMPSARMFSAFSFAENCSQTYPVVYQDNLKYHLYGGIILAAVSDYQGAARMLETVSQES